MSSKRILSLVTRACNTFCCGRSHQVLCINSFSQAPDKFKLKSSPPKDVSSDWIGPPDPVTNLRPTHFYIAEHETEVQRTYRLQREEVHKWNHEFWEKHNVTFVEEKDTFIKRKLKEVSDATPGAPTKRLSAEQLSEFYKAFLDKNRSLHSEYNREWYKRNIGLLWPAFRVKCEDLLSRRKRKDNPTM